MIAAFEIEFLGALILRGALLLALAHAALGMLRNRSAARREATGRWFCVALCLLPVVSVSRFWIPDHAPTAPPAGAATSDASCNSEPIATAAFAPPHETSFVESLAPWITWVWLGGTCILLLRFVLGHVLVQRRIPGRNAQPVPADLRIRLGIDDPSLAWISTTTSQPLVVGWLRPRIILPEAFPTWSPSRQRAVVGHEMAHIERHDNFARWLWQLTQALWWPVPLTQRLGRQLATAQEQACDDRALVTGMAPDDYAAALVDIARDLRHSPSLPSTVLAMTTSSQLETRVRSLLHSDTRRDLPRGWWPIAPAGIALTISLLAGNPSTTTPCPGETPSIEAETTPVPLYGPLPPPRGK